MTNSTNRISSVFLYGSLLPGHSNHHIAAGSIRSSCPGRIAGRLVDVGKYPALIRDEQAARSGNSVRGLWVTVDERGLSAMDALEAFIGIEEINDYDRVPVCDLDRAEQFGWVYIWDSPRGRPPIQGDYWPAFFARKSSLR